MADIKISQLPVAGVVNDNDIVVLNQGGDTKTAAKSLIVAGLATTDQISAFVTTSQVESIASAQIAAITPASIGALSTDAASGFATTDQISGFTTSSQVEAISASQISLITPESIGAFATSDVIQISQGGTGEVTSTAALAALGGISGNESVSGDLLGTVLSSNVVALAGNPLLFPQFPSSGQILQWNGTVWEPTNNPGGTVTSITVGPELTVDGVPGGTLSQSGTIALAGTGFPAGSYGSSTQVAAITFNGFGQITSASNEAITPAGIGALSTDAASGFATTSDIQGIAFTSQLSAFATTDQLSGYATTTDIQGIAFTSQLSSFTNSAQVEALASAQIAAITPGSIGAFATSDVIAITNGGTGSTSAVAALTALGALSATAAAGGDLSGNYPNPTVAKIQGQAVSSAAPSTGQVLTWNGTTWIATAPAAGGSGGGGVLFYFNYGTNPDAPAPVGAKELGRTAEVTLSSVTTGTLTSGVWTDVAGFVSDTLDPNLEFLPAGIFDFNVWCNGTANVNAPTVLRVQVNKWDGTTSTNIATSGNAVVSNNGTPIQTAISLVIPQTDITPADRLYIVIQVQASAAGHTVTVDFGDSAPSHVHTTIPSVGGTGVLKLINGVPQNPASFIIDADIATDAAIALSKVQMSQISVLTGDGLVGGGDLSTSRTLALATTGISAITVGSSAAVPVITANVYGQITALTTEAIPFNAGTVTSITAGTGLTGGTITSDGIIALETAGPGVLTNVGSSAAVPVISVDAYGRISALETASIAELGVGTVTSIAMTSQVSGLSFTPTTAITDNGTFNLTGVLDISNGGTGATDAVAALSNLGGITTDALSGYASTSQLAGLQPALTTAAPLGIELGGTGAITQEDARIAMGGLQQVDYYISGAIVGAMTTAGINVLTYTTPVALVIEGIVPTVGDTVFVGGQTAVSTPNTIANGPWIITRVGTASVTTELTRPAWFSGTVKNNTLCAIKYGNGSAGTVRAAIGPVTTSKVDITVGVTAITAPLVSSRNSNAVTAANTFNARQTFVANSATLNPISFSTATPTLLSTRQLGALEWDNQQLYITSSTQFALLNRNPIATATVLINAQAGAYTITNIASGSDAGKLITVNSASAVTVSIPTDATANSDFPIGTQILVMQLGAGQVTAAAVTPATTSVNSKNGTKTSGQYAVISLIKVAANSWVVGGDATT